MTRVLAVRSDNNGDVILVGPALRAMMARDAEVTLLCGPRGAPAGRLLPDVTDVLVFEAAWIDAQPQPLDGREVQSLIERVARGRFDEAVIFTSFHQSPLPMALLLRLAGVPRIGAISDDYPGSLLDVRHHIDGEMHEVMRNLSLSEAVGYPLPFGDDASLQLAGVPRGTAVTPQKQYVVVHPGATVPARHWDPQRNAELVEALARRGYRVMVTGARNERALTARVAGAYGVDLGGRTTFAEFAAIVRDAAVVVCGNTVAAHVAAAMHTPVVSLFPPTIPAVRFHPWRVDFVMFGDQNAPCAGCRARTCPIEGQPCLSGVAVSDVADAVDRFVTGERIAA